MTDFTLHVSDIEHPYRRWQLVESSAQEGDRVEVVFQSTESRKHRIQGTYLGRAHTALQSQSQPTSPGDQSQIVVVADTHYSWINTGSPADYHWSLASTVGSLPYVLDTKQILTIEKVNGPTLLDRAGRIDEGALEQAIRDALGGMTADSLVQAVVDIYVGLTD